jgi:hypothetical protein
LGWWRWFWSGGGGVGVVFDLFATLDVFAVFVNILVKWVIIAIICTSRARISTITIISTHNTVIRVPTEPREPGTNACGVVVEVVVGLALRLLQEGLVARGVQSLILRLL